MRRVVPITLSDYRAIMQWDEDGGGDTDITYEIVPDPLTSEKQTLNQEDFGSLEEDSDVADHSLVVVD